MCVNVDPRFTVPSFLKARYNDFRIKIYPQKAPNYWGNPTIWKMLIYTGFFHCRFVCKSRKRDPYAMVYAFFLAVTQNKNLDEIAQYSGKKIFQIAYGNITTIDGEYDKKNKEMVPM